MATTKETRLNEVEAPHPDSFEFYYNAHELGHYTMYGKYLKKCGLYSVCERLRDESNHFWGRANRLERAVARYDRLHPWTIAQPKKVEAIKRKQELEAIKDRFHQFFYPWYPTRSYASFPTAKQISNKKPVQRPQRKINYYLTPFPKPVKKRKVKKAKVVEGHGGKIGSKGYTEDFVSAAKTGMQIATMVGMANPTPLDGSVSEFEKPAGSETFDPPITIIENLASRMELASTLVQDTISTTFSPSKPSSSQGGYKPETMNYSYADMCSRPLLCKTFTWDTTQPTGSELFNLEIPQFISDLNNLHTTTLRQHALVQWDSLEFSAQYNVNAFAAGFARLSCIPGEYYDDTTSNYIRAITSNGVDLNASAMTQGSLVVPWCYNQSWLSTKNFWPNGMTKCGQLVAFVILPLQGVEGDQISLHIRVTVQIHGLRLAFPVPPITGPLFGPPVVTGQAGEDTASVVYFPRTNAWTNYEDGTSILRNVQPENLARDIIQDTGDAMDIKTIIQRPGITSYYNWSVDHIPGQVLSQEVISPLAFGDYGVPLCPLDYFARFAGRWNGKIRKKNMMAKSGFHTGKYAAVLIPIGHTITADNYLSFPHIIFDLKEDNITEFDCAFVSDHSTLQVPQTSSIAGITYGATLCIVCHTQLQANASMQPVINCCLWTSASDDFQLYTIVEPSTSIANRFNFLSQPGVRVQLSPPSTIKFWRADCVTPLINMGTHTWNLEGGPMTITDSANGINITITNLYTTDSDGWIRNTSAGFSGSDFRLSDLANTVHKTLDVASIVIGQSGVESAMHDKLQSQIPILGQTSNNSNPNMEYEKLNSLLQILERPHSISTAMTIFSGHTNADVDSFQLFNGCFVFTTGSVQTLSKGLKVFTNPMLSPTGIARVLEGSVRAVSASAGVLLVDHPPMTDGAIKSNLFLDADMDHNAKCFLTGFHFITEDPSVDIPETFLRAGKNFSYHMWAGIPTPELTLIASLAKENALVQPDIPLPSFDLNSMIETLRIKQKKSLKNIVIGQAGSDDEEKRKKSPFDRIKKMVKKRTAPEPPKTEKHVSINLSDVPTVEDGSDDDDDLEESRPSTSGSSSPCTNPFLEDSEIKVKSKRSIFMPTQLQDGIEQFSKAAHSVKELTSDAKYQIRKMTGVTKNISADIKDIRNDIKTTSHSFRSAADSVTRLTESGNSFIGSAKKTIEEVKTDGLLSSLFGSDSAQSKIIQLLLVDAIECVVIRKPAKWIGMLVKLGISFGLTRTLVNTIVDYFRRHTKWNAPNENQKGEVGGQSLQGHLPVITSLISVIVMYASFAYTGGTAVDKKKLPTMFDWIAERCRQTNMIDRGMDSAMKLFDKIHKWVVKIIKKFMPIDDDLYPVLREERFLKLAKDIIKDASPLLEVKVLVQIFMDWELRKKVFAIDKKYIKLLEFSADPDICRKHNTLFQKIHTICKELRARIISIANSPTVRIDPFHVSFYGKSGGGKSYLMSAVAYVLGRSQNVPVEDLFYARTPSTKHWDNYRGQEFVGIDDVDQQDNEELAGEMITIKSNVPKVLPMAFLETKGTLFTSRGLLSSTNVAYPEPKSIKCKEAYKRRRNVLVECLPVKTKGLKQDLSHFQFYIRDPVSSSAPPISKRMAFPELCAYLAREYSSYLKVQHQLVKRVAPKTEFRNLYVYDESERASLKLYMIVKEFFSDKALQDSSLKSFDEIDTTEIELQYPPPDEELNPEYFVETLERVPKKKPVVESDLDSDTEEEMEFDDMDLNFEIFGGEDANGQAGSEHDGDEVDEDCAAKIVLVLLSVPGEERFPMLHELISMHKELYLKQGLLLNEKAVYKQVADALLADIDTNYNKDLFFLKGNIADPPQEEFAACFPQQDFVYVNEYSDEEKGLDEDISSADDIKDGTRQYSAEPPHGRPETKYYRMHSSRKLKLKDFIKWLFDIEICGVQITREFMDVMATLTEFRFGSGIRDLPYEPVPITIPMSPEHQDIKSKFNEILQKIRNYRHSLFKDESNELLGKLLLAVDLTHYFIEKMDGEQTTSQSFEYFSGAVYFQSRAISLLMQFTSHQWKLGVFSQLVRNMNNRILPNNLQSGFIIEAYRTGSEAIITPWCVMQRVISESIAYVRTGLTYVGKMIYTCISERQCPEFHQLIKVGLFLAGGYLIYSFFFKKKVTVSEVDSKADGIIQAELIGEGAEDEEGRMVLPILTRSHKGMPMDGCKYAHYHQCEDCRNVYKETHVNTEKSCTYRLLCRPCRTRTWNRYKENKMKGIDSEKPVTEEVSEDEKGEVAGEVDLALKQKVVALVGGEALASSGGSLKEKFQKKLKVKGEALASSGGSMKEKFQKKLKIRGENCDEEKETKSISSEGFLKKYFGNFGLGLGEKSVVSGASSDDPSLLSIIPMIRRNMASIHLEGRRVGGLFLCGKWFCTVYHLITQCHDKALPYVINWKGQDFHGYIDTFKDLRLAEAVIIDGRKCPDDFVLIDMTSNRTLPAMKDIRHHIPTSEELYTACSSAGILIEKEFGADSYVQHSLSRINPVVDKVVKTNRDDIRITTHVALSWTYNTNVSSGSCGSPLLVRNSACPKKLIGFHYGAENGTTISYAHPLYRELIDGLINPNSVDGHCDLDDISSKCETIFDCFPCDLPENHGLRFVPQGRVLIYGKLKKEFVQEMPRKTDIVGSPFKDQIYFHRTEPSILTLNDPRAPDDIFQRGLDKFGRIHKNIRKPEQLKRICNYKLAKMSKLTPNYTGPIRTLTEDEAINGIPGNKYIPPLKMDASPGFPYVKLRPSGSTGRKFLFEETEKHTPMTPNYRAGPLLREHLDEIWHDLLNGKLKYNYFLDCLKVERRKISRLYKTRFFNIHNVAWLITYRRLHLAAAAFRLSNKFVLGTALGIDMHGPDSSRMMNLMRSKGDKFLAVDVEEWDGNLPSEEIAASFELNSRFIDVHEFGLKDRKIDGFQQEDAIRRRNLTYACNTRIHIAADCVYLAFQGMPSGIGATADVNSDDHDMQNYGNWEDIHLALDMPEMATFEMKDEHTCEMAVGDDGGGTVSDEASKTYNNQTVAAVYAHYGLKCQLPSKTKDGKPLPYTSVDDFEFLKCSFERDPEYRSIWHMKMNKDVIEELTNWVTIHGDPYELFYSNMADAQLFAFSHGKEYYDEFTANVNEVVARYGQPLLTTTYDDQRNVFLEKHGKVLL